MEKKEGIMMLVLLAILIMPTVLAVSTLISVKTLPNKIVDIYVYKTNVQYPKLESFHEKSGATGEVSVTANPTVSEIDVYLLVKDMNNKVLYNERLIGYTPGDSISLRALVGPEEVEEETVENATTEEEETVEEKEPSGITGFAIGDVISENKNTVYIIIGVIVGIAVIIIVIWLLKKKKKFGGGSNIKVVKMQEKLQQMREEREQLQGKEEKEEKASGSGLAAAEKRLKEAQAEVDKLKEKNKIEELEKRLEEERKELEKLKSEN